MEDKKILAKQMGIYGSFLQKRNILLKDSDWTVMPDSPLSEEKIAEWKIYRQALRDITDQEEFPYSITWPTRPE